MLMTQLLGSFAQFFSNMLGTHVSKGLDQRATEGLHTGGIPFGYQSCWVKEHGERQQTYNSGSRYYREHRGSRGHAVCPASGGSIPCEVADRQIGKIVEAVELGPRWEEEVLSIVSAGDEAESIKEKRQKVQERLRRLGKAYVDGVYDDEEYKRQKRTAELELGSLVLPEADAAAEAGKLISELQKLWSGANLQERRKLLMTMLDAVYVDSSENTIVAIKPKAPFKPVFGVATARDGSEVVLVHDLDARPRTADQPPPNGTVAPDGLEADDDPCLWWRRGEGRTTLGTRASTCWLRD